MKVQVDFDNKTVKVEGNVDLNELFETMTKMLGKLNGWTLENNTVINKWVNPVIIPWDPNITPWKPWCQDWSGEGTGPQYLADNTTGVVNCEFKAGIPHV